MGNLNTATEVRDEGNWDFVGWSPRIATSGAMDTFVGTLITRANAQLQQRVGVTWFAANVAVAPWASLLKEAEMHLSQAYLLDAAAAIAESGSDTNPAPFLGDGATLRELASDRMALFEGIVSETRTTTRTGGHVPVVRSVGTTPAIITRFDPVKGDPVS